MSGRAAKNILEGEETGKVRILNDKKEPTHVPYIKWQKKNCLELTMLIPGLEKRLKGYKLDIKRECTPAASVPTDKVYVKGKPSDHKALELQ